MHIKTNGNIDKRHKWKSNRYAHFVTDMPGYNCSVTAFDIGNKEHSPLYTLHKFVKPGVTLSKFK